jgi:hypothetical protein
MICHSKATFVKTAEIGRLKMMCWEQDVSDLSRNQLSPTGRLKDVYFRRRLALQSGGSDSANTLIGNRRYIPSVICDSAAALPLLLVLIAAL